MNNCGRWVFVALALALMALMPRPSHAAVAVGLGAQLPLTDLEISRADVRTGDWHILVHSLPEAPGGQQLAARIDRDNTPVRMPLYTDTRYLVTVFPRLAGVGNPVEGYLYAGQQPDRRNGVNVVANWNAAIGGFQFDTANSCLADGQKWEVNNLEAMFIFHGGERRVKRILLFRFVSNRDEYRGQSLLVEWFRAERLLDGNIRRHIGEHISAAELREVFMRQRRGASMVVQVEGLPVELVNLDTTRDQQNHGQNAVVQAFFWDDISARMLADRHSVPSLVALVCPVRAELVTRSELAALPVPIGFPGQWRILKPSFRIDRFPFNEGEWSYVAYIWRAEQPAPRWEFTPAALALLSRGQSTPVETEQQVVLQPPAAPVVVFASSRSGSWVNRLGGGDELIYLHQGGTVQLNFVPAGQQLDLLEEELLIGGDEISARGEPDDQTDDTTGAIGAGGMGASDSDRGISNRDNE